MKKLFELRNKKKAELQAMIDKAKAKEPPLLKVLSDDERLVY